HPADGRARRGPLRRHRLHRRTSRTAVGLGLLRVEGGHAGFPRGEPHRAGDERRRRDDGQPRLGAHADHRQIHRRRAVHRAGGKSGAHHRRWTRGRQARDRVPVPDSGHDALRAVSAQCALRSHHAALRETEDRSAEGEAMSWRETAKVRAWALRYVFLLFFVKPTVLEVTDERCEVVIPLNWRTKNHLKSMYFGALCIGADVAGGLIAFSLSSKMKASISFVFKDLKADFL